MSLSTPTFLLIPGAWHLPAYFDPVISYLSNHRYPSVAVTLPDVNSSPAATSIQSDVSVAADALTALLNNGSDVIVVMHSYGGIVGTDAVGRVVAERHGHGHGGGGGCKKARSKSKSGRIRRLVYVAAHVPLKGQTLFEAIDGAVQEPPPAPVHIDVEPPYYILNSHAPDILYNDVPEPVRSKYTKLLGKQPIATFNTSVVYAGWRSVPSTYVFTTLDRALEPVYQHFMVERAVKQGGKHAVTPFGGEMGQLYVESGHTPFLSMPQRLGEILVRAAEMV